ncbi:MAG: SRPBCC family protein [Bauldia sp.]|mgnify:CR=1 FL=1
MTKHSAVHETFVIERVYRHPPAKVFAAFATPQAKKTWFSGPPEWGQDEGTMDFRVGGRETSRGGPKGGPIHAFESRYMDIVANERIIFAYDMHLDDKHISVSLTTVELRPESGGKATRLVFTEQGVYLDGYDNAGQRKEGTEGLLTQLGAALDRGAVKA